MLEKIQPLIEYGHLHFGENKVQEAVDKWADVKRQMPRLQLHMIGKLQTNKVKYAVPLFDYIHSVDNFKLAEKIANEQDKNNKKLKIFIQINIGNELQKSGISTDQSLNLIEKCKNDLNLNIVGLMCIPPNNDFKNKYFSEMKKLSKQTGLKNLSMGMSNDYMSAIEYGANYIRIGSKIFGERV